MAQLVEHNLAKVGRVRALLSAPSHASGRFSNRPFHIDGEVAMGKAEACKKPLPPVRIRASPPDRSRPPKGGPFVCGTQIWGGAGVWRGARRPRHPGASKWSRKSHPARVQDGPNGTFCSIWDSNFAEGGIPEDSPTPCLIKTLFVDYASKCTFLYIWSTYPLLKKKLRGILFAVNLIDICRFNGGNAAEKKVHYGLFQEELPADGCRGDNGRIRTFPYALYKLRWRRIINDLVLAGRYEECQGGTMSLTACKKNRMMPRLSSTKRRRITSQWRCYHDAATDLEVAQAAEKKAAANLEAAQAAYDEAATANEAAQQHLKDIEGEWTEKSDEVKEADRTVVKKTAELEAAKAEHAKSGARGAARPGSRRSFE